MAGIGLCILYALFHSNPPVKLVKEKKKRGVLFYRWENQGLKELSNFAKSLVSERTGI